METAHNIFASKSWRLLPVNGRGHLEITLWTTRFQTIELIKLFYISGTYDSTLIRKDIEYLVSSYPGDLHILTWSKPSFMEVTDIPLLELGQHECLSLELILYPDNAYENRYCLNIYASEWAEHIKCHGDLAAAIEQAYPQQEVYILEYRVADARQADKECY